MVACLRNGHLTAPNTINTKNNNNNLCGVPTNAARNPLLINGHGEHLNSNVTKCVKCQQITNDSTPNPILVVRPIAQSKISASQLIHVYGILPPFARTTTHHSQSVHHHTIVAMETAQHMATAVRDSYKTPVGSLRHVRERTLAHAWLLTNDNA